MRIRVGDRVEVRGLAGQVLYRGIVTEWTGRGSVWVQPDGRTKALPVASRKVRPVSRSAPPAQSMTRAPDYSASKPRAQPKPQGPIRSERYLDFVRGKRCLCCCEAGKGAEAHHWGPRGSRGVGQKTDDTRTVPLCPECHGHFHATGTLPGHTPKLTRVRFLVSQVDLLTEFLREGGKL